MYFPLFVGFCVCLCFGMHISKKWIILPWSPLLCVLSSFAMILKRERERERERERAGCFAFIVLRMSCCCKCSVAISQGAVGLSAVCDCGIS